MRMRIHLDHSRVASHLVVIGFQGRDCPTRTGPAYLAIVSTLLSQPPPLTAHHSTLFISLSVYNMGVEVPSDPAPNGYVSNPHQEKIDEALRYLRSEKQGGEGWENIGWHHPRKEIRARGQFSHPYRQGTRLVKDLSAQALLSTILQPSARHLWDERFASGALLERYGRRTYKFYSVQKGVGWLVSERDIVGVQHVQDGENGAFEVVQTSVEGDPDNSGRVRATLTCAGWSVVPRGNDLEVAYVVKSELVQSNGSIPSAVVGKIVQDIPLAVVNITNFIRNKGVPPYITNQDLKSQLRTEVVDVEKRHHEIRLIAGDTDEELKIAVDPKLFGGNWSVGVTGDGVAAEKDGDTRWSRFPPVPDDTKSSDAMATPFIDSEVAPVQYYHLQSHTPPPAEKTLLWLQGVNDAGPLSHPAVDSTSEYAAETPGQTRREEPPSDWIPPSYLQPKVAEEQSGKSESKMGLDLEYAVFGDHGAGSEASYQRTLQQAAGGYPTEEHNGEELDIEPEGDLYDDDVDSNEQERPESLMSPNNRTVPIEDPNNSRSPRYLSQSTGPSFGNINRPSSFAPMHTMMEKGPNVNIQIQPPTDRTHSRTGRESEITMDPVGQITDEMDNLWSGSALPPIKTQGTGTSAKWKPPTESAGSEASFYRNSGPIGSGYGNVAPPHTGLVSTQITGSRGVAPQQTGTTNRQSTARGTQVPVQPQMTGMTGKQSTRGAPIAPQMTGKQSTAGGRHSMGASRGAPIQPQQTGMTNSRQSTARVQPQMTGSKSSKVIPQMTGKSGRTSMSRAGQSVSQPGPRHSIAGSAVGGQSTTPGRAKSPLGRGSVTGGYQSFGDMMQDPAMNDNASYADELDEGQYPGAYPGTDGNSFAGEGMAYMGEDIGRAPSVAESANTLRGEKKLHPLAGSAVAPSEGGMHPLRSVPPSEAGGSIAPPYRTGSPAGSRISHRRSASGAGGPPADRSGTPTRSYHNHHSHGDSTPTPSEAGFIDRVPDMSERELLEVLKTPRTSYTVSPSVLAEEVSRTHYHDEDLCILLHAAEDPSQHEVIRKAVRKAAKMRIKRLGIEDEQRKREPLSIAAPPDSNVAPQWARPLFDMLQDAQTRLESLEGGRNRIEAPPSHIGSHRPPSMVAGFDLNIGRTPMTAHGNIDASTVPSGTHVGESVLGGKTADYQQPLEDEFPDHSHEHEQSMAGGRSFAGPGTAMDQPSIAGGEGDVEEELYKLRVKQPPPRSEVSHNGESAVSAPPDRDRALQTYQAPPVWQRVHQRLLNWAMVWPLTELDKALASTERGHQVEEIALSVWCTQVYKRYVRARMSEGGGDVSKVDRMYVPPNMADAISTAVYNGRHGRRVSDVEDFVDAVWVGGHARLIIVLARHRGMSIIGSLTGKLLCFFLTFCKNRIGLVWIGFSLPDGQLSTYDTYPEKSLPMDVPLDGGSLFVVHGHMRHTLRRRRPCPKNGPNQSPAPTARGLFGCAAAIWRNLLMGSKANEVSTSNVCAI
ncbi:hypothetical protein RHS01_09147 [Rhizoctonia solani]|uniref:START domain-containing protein n=1 Tax=Rhizoctonia solani TaxID=456999 RepID=A0A8H7I407_9AGAM|nr:hypothetical protein RHS01_09147 [Rhizoctonia solani]